MGFDTIIVGGGSAGCVLANRLSADPARKVLLLEAGRAAPLNSDIPANWVAMFNTGVDWGYHTEPQIGCRGRRIFWPRGKMLGGSGALNAMIYIRGLPSDYDGWEAAGCAGWGWKNVLPAFLRSENNLRLGNAPLHAAGGELTISDVPYIDPHERLWHEAAQAAGFPDNQDFNGPVQEGVGWFQLTVKDGERFGTAKGFLRPIMDRPNLTVRTGVLTTRILLENGRAKGVTFLDRGVPETVLADEVVLSAGSIGSAQLLLLSGVGPADELSEVGVSPVHDLPGVGKTLRDHINIPITFAARERVGIGGMTGDEILLGCRWWLCAQRARSGGAGFAALRRHLRPSRPCALHGLRRRGNAARHVATAKKPGRIAAALGRLAGTPLARPALFLLRPVGPGFGNHGGGRKTKPPHRRAITTGGIDLRRNHPKRRCAHGCGDR
jgi:choline dehydrogenase